MTGRFEPGALRRWIPAIVAAALLLGATAMVIGRDLTSPSASSSSSSSPTGAPARADSGFIRFRDTAADLSILQPASWRRLPSPDPEVRLLAEGDGSSMLVRMADLGIEVGPESVRTAKRLTDELVRSAGGTRMLRPPQRVTLAGLPGYLYLYTFRNATTGERGAHAHYFLFRGRTLIAIVFQTAPADRLLTLAPAFDRIGESLRLTADGDEGGTGR